ncbi:hypothetical protein CFC21_002137 [Triticum aestivum]|uniref:RING-CH-type domain-containing protein n=1 Tax=Triticum aestivum TaxID=4565 RepID=A0A3B5Y032_WHEAT|nr:hypothetical protein CFC21_002137 [Triticum aestivum]
MTERQDEAWCSCSPRQCRICHEEEGDDGCATATAMESPCGCSGSLKYAHRGCVQRWCDEKGSTVCEICLQNYEPGYTVAPKKTQVAHVAVTIRGSLEVPRQDYEAPEDAVLIGLDAAVGDPAYAECASAAGRSAAWCRSVTVTFTVVLLLRHLIALVTVGAANQYAFSLLTIYLLRASGILLPFYVLMRLISAVQHGQMQYRLQMLQVRCVVRVLGAGCRGGSSEQVFDTCFLLQDQRRNASRMQHGVPGQRQQQHVILVV